MKRETGVCAWMPGKASEGACGLETSKRLPGKEAIPWVDRELKWECAERKAEWE